MATTSLVVMAYGGAMKGSMKREIYVIEKKKMKKEKRQKAEQA